MQLKQQREGYNKMMEQAHNAVLDKGIVTDVLLGDGEDIDDRLNDVPFWDQGNLDHYTMESLAIRHAIRHDNRVKAQIERFWYIVEFSKAMDGAVAKNSYLKLMSRFYRCLVGEMTEQEARALVEEDWRKDITANSSGRFTNTYSPTYMQHTQTCTNTFKYFATHWIELTQLNELSRSNTNHQPLHLFTPIRQQRFVTKTRSAVGLGHALVIY